MVMPCLSSTTEKPFATLNDSSHTVYLGLGSNLGDKEENIRRAVAMIAGQIGTIVRQSALYYSEPWGYDSCNTFVNAVVCVATTLPPRRLLRATQRIERALGKTRRHATERPAVPPGSVASGGSPAAKYHDRPIDIDILLYDDAVISYPDLVIPHPLMRQRPFVMEPLRELGWDG